MASSSTKKSESSGLRILWFPGRKSHSKDRLSTTKKHITYSGPQKKRRMWTLGFSKAQSERTDLPLSDLEGEGNVPSSLSLVATCSLAAQSECALSTDSLSAIASETVTIHSTLLTANSPPNLRPTFSLSEIATSTPSTKFMTSTNVITTAEIQNIPHSVGPEDFAKVPTATMAHGPTPQKINNTNHNNNQEDINSIESISSSSSIQENAIDFDWIDEMVEQRNCNEMMHKNIQKRASQKGLDSSLQPEADQLDGPLYSFNSNEKATNNSTKGTDDDELVVKCLYYSLMCCDCRIS